jgi:L-ribulose-5-phosphate 3-epimerase
MARIGIMQGRLVPAVDNRIQCFPRNNWEKEFLLAAEAKIECIEWIYDLYGADINPLSTDTGIEKIKTLSSQYKVEVLSLCADYFMDKPFLRISKKELNERLETLFWLIERCQKTDINRIILPFVDSSQINTKVDMEDVIAILKNVIAKAENAGVEIHLETSLPPKQFAELLDKIKHKMLKVNYDSGNSSSLGYKPKEEFEAYGNRVGSVHIKDRVYKGTTVPLGTGDANFDELFNCLNQIKYSGDYILQVARGVTGGEVAWAKENRVFVQKFTSNSVRP